MWKVNAGGRERPAGASETGPSGRFACSVPANQRVLPLPVSLTVLCTGAFKAVLATGAVIILLAACATSTKLVTRTPAPSLMVPCETPQMLPAKPTGNDIGKALVDTTRIALDCKAKHDGLIEFELAAPK